MQAAPLDHQWEARADVELLAQATDRYLRAWHGLKDIDEVRDASKGDRRMVCSALLLCRACQLVDAATAVSTVGRPTVVRALNRMQYEAYLHGLLLHYGWSGEGERMDAVQRFLDEAHIDLTQSYRKNVRSLVTEGKKRNLNAKEVNDKILQNADHIKSYAEGGVDTIEWHGFTTVDAIRDNLWPPNAARKIPERVFPGGQQDWQDLYKLHWHSGCYFIHNKPVILLQEIFRDFKSIRDDRCFDPKPLDDMLLLFDHQVLLFAHQCGHDGKWNEVANPIRERCSAVRAVGLARARSKKVEL